MQEFPICVLSIAGSDSSGGAGIQADLKTFAALGVWGESAITSITAQNSRGVFAIMDVDPSVIVAQINTAIDDTTVKAIKIGMLSNTSIIQAIKETLSSLANPVPVILDPVMVAKSGTILLKPQAMDALKDLIPKATLLTPNIPEAQILLNRSIETPEDMRKSARDLSTMGCNILLKGGHLKGNAHDILYWEGEIYEYEHPRVISRQSKEFHGTGCTLSSAIATFVALGYNVPVAVQQAKDFVVQTILNSISVGHGVPYLHHLYALGPLPSEKDQVS